MVQVNEQEALRIIQSLSAQLSNGSPNTGRTEFTTEEQEYFSIAVHDDTKKVIPPKEMEVEFIYDRIQWEGKNGRELAHSINKDGSLAELVDALDSKSSSFGSKGSIPLGATDK